MNTTEFSFNSSGWLQVFQVGVVYFFQHHVKLNTISAVGSSGGATTAAIMVFDIPADIAAEKICSKESLVKKDFKSIVKIVHKSIHEMIPMNAIDFLKNNCLGIVCSEIKNYRNFSETEFKKFTTREDIVELLCATCHIPSFNGYLPYRYNGKYLYDGVFTSPHPKKGNKVIYISCTLNCRCGCENNYFTISPSVEFPLRWCILPQDKKILRLIFYHGYCQSYRKFKEDPNFKKLFKFKNNIVNKKNNDNSLNTLMNSKICGNNEELFDLAINNQHKIEFYLSKQIKISNREWSGCKGYIKYLYLFVRIFFPCLPIIWCTQDRILRKHY